MYANQFIPFIKYVNSRRKLGAIPTKMRLNENYFTSGQDMRTTEYFESVYTDVYIKRALKLV